MAEKFGQRLAGDTGVPIARLVYRGKEKQAAAGSGVLGPPVAVFRTKERERNSRSLPSLIFSEEDEDQTYFCQCPSWLLHSVTQRASANSP